LYRYKGSPQNLELKHSEMNVIIEKKNTPVYPLYYNYFTVFWKCKYVKWICKYFCRPKVLCHKELLSLS